MNGLNNLKTGVRLFAGFALITLLLLFIAYVGYSNIQTVTGIRQIEQAAHNLNDLAAQLSALVQRYKVA